MYNKKHKLSILILTLSCLIRQAVNFRKLCSVYCSNMQCNSRATNDCATNLCRSGFTWNVSAVPPKCQPSTGLFLTGLSADVGGLITTNASYSGSCNTVIPGEWSYTFYGPFTGTTVLTFYDPGINVPHYQIRIIFWMLLIDLWPGTDKIFATIQGNQTQLMYVAAKQESWQVCGSSAVEFYMRFDRNFQHSDSSPYTIQITTNNNTQKWGMKQLVVMAKLCHPACLSCSGPSIDQCSSCSQSPTYYVLSGLTCNQTCLPGYGMTNLGLVCVLCNLRCTVCFQLADNCSACVASGAYTSYLYLSNSSCEIECPANTYLNNTDRVCYLCDTNCLKCSMASTNCTSCDTALSYLWFDYKCYNACPIGTYSVNSTNCSACSPYCIACSISPTNCSVCTLTGINTAYLNGTNCVVDCGPNFYEDTAGGLINTCQPCDPSCSQCAGNPFPCTMCAPGAYLFNKTCVPFCPSNFIPNNTTWQCLPGQTVNPIPNEAIRSSMPNTQILHGAVVGSSSFVFFLCLFRFKIVGVQLFGVLQIAYFSLIQYDFMNIYSEKLISKFRISNGFNIILKQQTAEEKQKIPQQLLKSFDLMNMNVSFLNNFNIMFFVMVVVLLFIIMIQRIFYSTKQQQNRHRKNKILREVLIILAMFNCYNIVFTACIYAKYQNKQNQTIKLCNLFLILASNFILFAAIVVSWPLNKAGGQFQNLFKESMSNQVYIFISFLYRVSLGLVLALYTQNEYTPLILIGLSIVFMLYFIINTPYAKFYHNYRAFIVHFTTVYILFSANYHSSMQKHTPVDIKSANVSVIIVQLALIFLCIIVSLSVQIYEIYIFFKKLKNSGCFRINPSKKIKSQTLATVTNEPSFQGFHFKSINT